MLKKNENQFLMAALQHCVELHGITQLRTVLTMLVRCVFSALVLDCAVCFVLFRRSVN